MRTLSSTPALHFVLGLLFLDRQQDLSVPQFPHKTSQGARSRVLGSPPSLKQLPGTTHLSICLSGDPHSKFSLWSRQRAMWPLSAFRKNPMYWMLSKATCHTCFVPWVMVAAMSAVLQKLLSVCSLSAALTRLSGKWLSVVEVLPGMKF